MKIQGGFTQATVTVQIVAPDSSRSSPLQFTFQDSMYEHVFVTVSKQVLMGYGGRYEVGSTIILNQPLKTDLAANYSITPDLVPGLAFDNSSGMVHRCRRLLQTLIRSVAIFWYLGAITGTPSTVSARTAHTISRGSSSTVLYVQVNQGNTSRWYCLFFHVSSVFTFVNVSTIDVILLCAKSSDCRGRSKRGSISNCDW